MEWKFVTIVVIMFASSSSNKPFRCNAFSSQSKLIEKKSSVHFNNCPGCSVESDVVTEIESVNIVKRYFSSPIMRKHRLKEESEEELFRIIVPSSTKHWRTQSKLAVSAKSNWNGSGCIFGLYKRNSHEVISCPECIVHHPQVNCAIKTLSQATKAAGINAYDEKNGSGDLRYVQIQIERTTNKIVLTLVWNADRLKDCQPALSRLVRELKELNSDWHSIWCHFHTNIGNNIFARSDHQWSLIFGPEFHRERLPGTLSGEKKGLLFYTPKVFRQGNLDGFDVIVEQVARSVPPDSILCELYAGVGVLGLTTLSYMHYQNKEIKLLRCSDENPANLDCFWRAVSTMAEANNKNMKDQKQRRVYKKPKNSSIKKSSKLQDGKVSYMVASASTALKEGQAIGANVLIVDPPRKGLDDFVLTHLCKPRNKNQSRNLMDLDPKQANLVNDVHTLIYVSCGFNALLSDCDKLLSSNGGWKIESSTGYIIFPGSNHVETVVIFQREKKRI